MCKKECDIRRLKTKTIITIGILIGMLCPFTGCASYTEEPVMEVNRPELIHLVEEYYKALSMGDESVLARIVSPWSEGIKEQLLSRSAYDSYMNVEVFSFPGVSENSFVIYPYYEGHRQTSDSDVPTLSVMYAEDDAENHLYLKSDWQSDDAIKAYVETLSDHPQLKAVIASVKEKVESMSQAPQSNGVGDTAGIHRYEVFIRNCNWNEANDDCIAKGGHLVCFETREELDFVIGTLEKEYGKENRFYIGGLREYGDKNYYWAIEKGKPTIALNDPAIWCRDVWLTGEPTYRDDTINADEDVMEMFYFDSERRWVWNDIPNDLPKYIGQGLSVGYICEYEN